MAKKYQQLINDLKEFELKNHIENLSFHDLDLWPLVRFKIFMKLVTEKKSKSNQTLFSIIKFLIFAFLKNNFKKLNSFTDIKYIFLGSENGRRTLKHDKRYHIFIDALIDKYDIENYLVFELNNSYPDIQKYSKNILSIDWLMIKNRFLANLLYFVTPITSYELGKLLKDWDFSYLSITKAEIKKMLHLTYLEYKANAHSLKRIIKKIRPKILFLTCSYCYWNNMAIQFFNKKNIKTVELQHGIINENHVGYIYPQKRTGNSIPTHFLVFGKKEFDILKDKIDSNIIIEGNNYFQLIQENNCFVEKDINLVWPQLKNKKIILVTSQMLTSSDLIPFFEKVSNLLSPEYFIVYRLHQNERAGFTKNKYYNLLLKKNVVIQTDDRISLPQLLKIASVHTSVFSTVLEEAIAFSTPNIIIKKDGWKNVEYLVKKGFAVAVDTPEEFVDLIKNFKKMPNIQSDYFYIKQSNGLKQIL
ncbi:MAG: hypothetical protein PHY34_01300 [Patescibacteria group bacterium]|nr:hypothetical protein [Patescibacteria group bacterium]MDD5715144.1 hypothetical protein [Patescibacteria group bacterium]